MAPLFSRWSRFKNLRIILRFPYFVTAPPARCKHTHASPKFSNDFYYFNIFLCPLSLVPLKSPVRRISGQAKPAQWWEHFFKHVYLFMSIPCSSPLWDSWCFSLKSKILGRPSRYVIIWPLHFQCHLPSPQPTHTALIWVLQGFNIITSTAIDTML